MPRHGPQAGLALLDVAAACQPYWATRVHLAAELGDTPTALYAYEMAIGLATDPAVRAFLLERRTRAAKGRRVEE